MSSESYLETDADDSYDALKKLFPSNPLDPSYFSTQQHQESSSLLPTTRSGSDKWASPEEFRIALDRERKKVEDFYHTKLAEIQTAFEALESEVRSMEDRDLGEDVIKEEEEEEEELAEFRETDDLLGAPPPRPSVKNRTSFMNRMAPSLGRRRRSILPTAAAATHEADLHESQLRTQRSRSTGRISFSADDGSNLSPKAAAKGRRSSDVESSEDGPSHNLIRDRRTSSSSTSSHDKEPDFTLSSRAKSLGLVLMDPAEVPDWLWRPQGRDVEEDAEQREPVYIWTGTGNYGTFARISLKKKISRVWLDTYSLKQYVDLNLTAFEKILKKYDKNTNSKVC
jgi:phosphate transporter